MLIERFMNSHWLSNSFIVAAGPASEAILIDSGGSKEEILYFVKDQGLKVRTIFCTHHHHDHIAHNLELKSEWKCTIAAHKREANLISDVDVEFDHKQIFEIGSLSIQVLHLPGHTAGQSAFLVQDQVVFTGDTLFRGSVGGTCGPGHTTYEDLRHSIMETLMGLPPETKIFPGHMDETDVGTEWKTNPFIRFWRGLEENLNESCTAFGRGAKLKIEAKDYDGGSKGLVEFEDSHESAIVPGSSIRRKIHE